MGFNGAFARDREGPCPSPGSDLDFLFSVSTSPLTRV